ncbi:MAE_28990/MAE_18760 family HEPN-like nuclease [Tistrella mobilis]
MKIRTVNDLIDKIGDDRVWRLREISSLYMYCQKKGDGEIPLRAAWRSFVPIAYAHWEGFVKKSSHYYLEFVASQSLMLSELNINLLAFYLHTRYKNNIGSSKPHSIIDLCKEIENDGSKKISIKYKDVISTKSNLNYEIFVDICKTLGIDWNEFASKEKFIDRDLLSKRNHIAHGEDEDMKFSDVEQIKSEVVYLIDTFRNKIDNAAVTKAYRR